jgi:outer membrane protein assembly factor BamB
MMNKKQFVNVVISMLLFATFFSVAGIPSTSKSNPSLQATQSTDWWSMRRHDPQATGYSTSTTPTSTTPYWNKAVSNPRMEAVVNGHLFSSSGAGMYAYYATNGSQAWMYSGGGTIASNAYGYGNLYFGSDNNYLYCVNATTGAFHWSLSLGNKVRGIIAIAYNKIYVTTYPLGTTPSSVFCIDAYSPTILWNYTLPGSSKATYCTVADGRVYVPSNGGNIQVFAANASGTNPPLWNYAGGFYTTQCASVVNGKLYIGSYSVYGKFYCFDATAPGNPLWNVSIGDSIANAPAVANDNIFIVTRTQVGTIYPFKLYCLYALNGTTRWSKTVSDSGSNNPIIVVADSKVFVTVSSMNGSNVVYGFNANDGSKIWTYTTSLGSPLNMVIADQSIYISLANNILCFKENIPPSPPSNPIPIDGATGVDRFSDLSWTATSPDGDALTYDVYFGSTSPPPKVKSNQSATTYDPGTMLTNTVYYWRIVVWDSHSASASGPTWSFTTANFYPPSPPQNPSPTNGATLVALDTDLQWTCAGDPDGGSVTYDVYFSTTNPPLLQVHNQSATTYNPGTMLYNTIYYWKIIVWDEEGVSAEGPIWHFTTQPESTHAPNVPSNPNPEDQATNVPVNTGLTWIGGDPDILDIVTYDIYFGTVNPPSLIISNHPSSGYSPPSLNISTTYFWKIVAHDDHGLSSEGPTWSFTTGSENWWPMRRHDPQGTGYAAGQAPNQNVTNWKFQAGNYIASCSVVADGKVFFGSADKKVYCLDADGNRDGTPKLIWSFTTNGRVLGTPAVSNGKVYIGSEDKKLYCLDEAGNGDGTTTVLWQYTFVQTPINPIVSYGKVYVYADLLYCLDAIGNISAQTTTLIWSSPIVPASIPAVTNGRVYLITGDYVSSSVYCLDAYGDSVSHTTTTIWSFTYPVSYGASDPAVANGHVYVVLGYGATKLLCLDATGNGDGTTKEVWSYLMNGEGNPTSPVVAYGHVYVQDSNAKVYCFNAETGGTPLWQPAIGAGLPKNLAAADGKLYGAALQPGGLGKYQVFCLDAQTGLQLWKYDIETGVTSPVIADKKVYFGSINKNLTCIRDDAIPTVPTTPTGPTEGVIGLPITFSTMSTDTDGDKIQYGWNWTGGSVVDTWSSFTEPGETAPIQHNWNKLGTYTITVKARDQNFQTLFSSAATITIINHAPTAPDKPNGPIEGNIGEYYHFQTKATDPDGHKLKYGWDKNGDLVVDKWVSTYYDSGVTVDTVLTWSDAGVFDVRVMTQDYFGMNSTWSQPLTITIYDTTLEIGTITGGFFKVDTQIKNIGNNTANNVKWNITLIKNGAICIILKGGQSSGVLASMNAQKTVTVTDKPILGFGKVKITVDATADGVKNATKTVDGFVFLFYIIIKG